MKHLLRILSAILLCCTLLSCSAEKRLGRILYKHPELKERTDTILLRDTVFIEAASAGVFIPDSAIQEALESTPQTDNQNNNILAQVAVGNSSASLRRTDGGFALDIEQKADTIILTKKIPVPVYRYIPAEATIPFWVSFFASIGKIVVAFFAIIILLIIIRQIIIRYGKKI